MAVCLIALTHPVARDALKAFAVPAKHRNRFIVMSDKDKIVPGAQMLYLVVILPGTTSTTTILEYT
jgi:hypothetical protein